MSTFEDKLDACRQDLIERIRQTIHEHNHNLFATWLQMEADLAFGGIYQSVFREHFEQYINAEIESQLWFAAKNILYVITAYREVNPNYEIDDLLAFVEVFILKQIDDFSNDYGTTEWFNNQAS